MWTGLYDVRRPEFAQLPEVLMPMCCLRNQYQVKDDQAVYLPLESWESAAPGTLVQWDRLLKRIRETVDDETVAEKAKSDAKS